MTPIAGILLSLGLFLFSVAQTNAKVCTLQPLGAGLDDTDQVEAAISECGQYGQVIFGAGDYNITRKMTWNLVSSQVDLYGYLSFIPDYQYWLNYNSTYRVVFIQDQASWFVVTGNDFIIDAHGQGGIKGNGQPWWSYYATGAQPRLDGDGRPIAFTLSHVQRGVVNNFHIDSPPFWCNTVADSVDVVYDGMVCNATNTDTTYAGQNIVPNTDGIDTYRSDSVSLLNWDVTCGDDCLAIKGNTTNLYVQNVICRGGNGIAFGSLGQYVDLPDNVENVVMENLQLLRLPTNIQPNMGSGVYFKSWTATVNGTPPTGGGGGTGYVKDVVARNVYVDRVNVPMHLYQTNGGYANDTPSYFQFSNLSFYNWTGTSLANKLADIECSPNAPCPNMVFGDFDVTPPAGTTPSYVCVNVVSETGLPGPCNATGRA
ncbi:glycoside hydrolase family 28 protein [Jaapia argillacea MUCL 33604]|uniref:galacturonan 1,4-alpha-galacturonidase n=1 Tax=Jaapia argillacea MUCL 33604 TaxID=933084 RepID=A0A067PS78_9AGAM|nr:glycoside hydrolase family 28 protein [Jaapia argillacea MUCL 33604]